MNDTAEAGGGPDLGVCLISVLKEWAVKKKKKHETSRNFRPEFYLFLNISAFGEFYLTAKCECSVY